MDLKATGLPQSTRLRGNGYPLSRKLIPGLVPLASCKPLGRETRKHSAQQVRKLAASLARFGFVYPILIDSSGRVVAGSGLVLAAKELGLAEIPAVTIRELSEAELRVLRLALNRITEDATWDREELALEFSEILQLDPLLELQASGFEISEINSTLDVGGHNELNVGGPNKQDQVPRVDAATPPTTRLGDLWRLGDHYLLCGDALQGESFSRAMGDETADVVFADLPNALGNWKPELGAVGPIDLMPSGKLSVKVALGHAACWSRDGAIHFVCTDSHQLPEVLAAGNTIYGCFENLCVWVRRDRNPAASGLLYRPQHQLILVFRVGQTAPITNVKGRGIRTDVWDYPNSKGSLGTCKPVAMIADAIRDCSKRGGVILDPFGGCGTTLIAAEQTARCARLIELDPSLVDLSIERWQRLTGGTAHHVESGRAFVRNHDAG